MWIYIVCKFTIDFITAVQGLNKVPFKQNCIVNTQRSNCYCNLIQGFPLIIDYPSDGSLVLLFLQLFKLLFLTVIVG